MADAAKGGLSDLSELSINSQDTDENLGLRSLGIL